MVIGARRSAFNLSPQAQLQAYISYDPITRRKVRFIETIVPTLSIDSSVPADIYYADPGATLLPEWVDSVGNLDAEHWDATDEGFYAILDLTASVSSTERIAWPLGGYGTAQAHTPKNGEVAKCVFEFRARFNANADYTVYGVGLLDNQTGALDEFDIATDMFIQVLRNAGAWELGTCDGSTISQSSGGTADGDFHDFRVEWESGEVRLYVDNTLEITKTTNLPTEPLGLNIVTDSVTNTIHLMGVKISWL